MNGLARLAALLTSDNESAPVVGAGTVTTPVPSDDEAAAQAAVQRAEATLADLTSRRENLVSTIAGLTGERSRLSRLLATGDLDAEARFAEVEVAIATAQARLSGLDELLGEAKAALAAAYGALRETAAPRLAQERQQRVAEATERADVAAQELRARYRAACAATGELAERLDELAALGGNPSGIEHALDDQGSDELTRMIAEGWRLRESRWLPARRAIVCAAPPPEGGAPWPK